MKVMMMVVVMVAMMVCEWCVMMMTMVMSESHVRAVRVSLDGHNCAAHPHRYRQGTTHCDLCPSAGLGHSLATERGAEWVSHDGHTRRDADTHTHVSTWRSGNCDSGGRETAVGDMARSESLGAMASCKWWCPALIVCIYGFVSQLRPAESFLMPFLLSPDKNLTREQITNEVMPVLVYSYMAVLVPVFLLSDLLRYKPMLVLQSASLVAVWLLLLFTRGILGIQFVEFFYGVSMAARVAFSPILFALVETGHVQRVTSVSRAATLLGLFGSSALGQLCVTVWGVSYATLNRVSLGFVSVSFLFSLFLPWPRRSLFFHRPPPGDVAAVAAADGRCPERGPLAKGDADAARGGGFGVAAPAAGSAVSAGRAAAATYLEWLRRAGRAVASSPSLCSWCAWWVFGMAGYYMVLYYVQLLWDEVEPSRDNPRVYNGATEATSTLLSEAVSACVRVTRCAGVAGRGLPARALGRVGGAAARGGGGAGGGAALRHERHAQHLALLRRLRALPHGAPAPTHRRHVPDRQGADAGVQRAGVRGEHVPRHRAADRRDACRVRQARPLAVRARPVLRLLRLLRHAGCGVPVPRRVHLRHATALGQKGSGARHLRPRHLRPRRLRPRHPRPHCPQTHRIRSHRPRTRDP
ncbi:uncharacterized protein LOC133356811 isoform X2 [Lethenteron reissneri]|uniref:uncharacterized protein LOC133356811 isoform X2 n=1 Tax=Lethenteron reissneri TaxID=7753 RepID=UPI002AB79003|nr:uncharacterized protein LOC133356811 isoform X2 [Lethenteron reissneri]